MPPKLGILAGSGNLPGEIINFCQKTGRPYFVVGIENNTKKQLLENTPHTWATLGAAGKIIKILRDTNVEEIVMAGAIKRPAWDMIQPDWRGLKILPKLLSAKQGDAEILSLVINELEKEGFRVIGVGDILTDIVTAEGSIGSVRPDKVARQDIARALEVGLALRETEVGQAMVVQRGVVLGIEAAEGTDALMERCSNLHRAGPGGILLKLKMKNQDQRVDLPTIGPKTIKMAQKTGIRGIALEAQGSLILEQACTIKKANFLKIFIVGIKIEQVVR